MPKHIRFLYIIYLFDTLNYRDNRFWMQNYHLTLLVSPTNSWCYFHALFSVRYHTEWRFVTDFHNQNLASRLYTILADTSGSRRNSSFCRKTYSTKFSSGRRIYWNSNYWNFHRINVVGWKSRSIIIIIESSCIAEKIKCRTSYSVILF